MSLVHGASINRNGLVFQYDMANTAKSWKGKPTTNYAYGSGILPTSVAISDDLTFDRIGDGTGFPASYPHFMKGKNTRGLTI